MELQNNQFAVMTPQVEALQPERQRGLLASGVAVVSLGLAVLSVGGEKVAAVDDDRIPPSGTLCFDVGGQPGDLAVVNLTPVLATGPGDGVLHPSGQEAPHASNVNFGPGTVDPNVAATTIGPDGQVCYTNSRHSSVHLVADHLATIKAEAVSPQSPSAPERKVDTRASKDGQVPPSGRLCFEVAGNPGDVALINLTPVLANGAGDGVLFPHGEAAPHASNVNFARGTVDPNVAAVEIGVDGQVCYQNSFHSSVDLVADHLATIKAEAVSPLSPSAPERKVDTRATNSQIYRGGRLCFDVAGDPEDLVLVNLTPVLATGPGDGVLHPGGTEGPLASNVNFGPGTVDPNVAATTIGPDGQVCYTNSRHSIVHLVADHLATIKKDAVSSESPASPERKADTRGSEDEPKGVGVLSYSGPDPIRLEQIQISCDYQTYRGSDLIMANRKIVYTGLTPPGDFWNPDIKPGDRVTTEYEFLQGVGDGVVTVPVKTSSQTDQHGVLTLTAGNSENRIDLAQRLRIQKMRITRTAPSGQVSVTELSIDIACQFNGEIIL